MSDAAEFKAERDAQPDRLSFSDRETGLPGLRSWRIVYAIVFSVFLVWVGLLTWLTEYYSP